MKKLSLLLPLLLSSIFSISQNIKPFNLKDFEGKKIISLFKSTTEIRGGWPGIPTAPTNQYHTINRSVSFEHNENNTFVKKIIYKVNIDVENLVTLEHREFDTERKFDRSMEQSLVYGKYDNFINKPFSMIYDYHNKRIDSLKNFKDENSYFLRAWGDEKLPFLQEEWIGVFQINLPTENVWKVGQTWQQIIQKKIGQLTKNESITNTYTVKSIVNELILIDIKGVNIPEQVMYKRSDGYVSNILKDNKNNVVNEKINYTVEQKTHYEGTIKINSKNNMVLKMEISTNAFKRIHQKDMPISGPESTDTVTIENTLEDLK